MRAVVLLTTFAGTLLYAGEKPDLKTVEGVVSCSPVLDKTSPRPAVCGRCDVRVEGSRLFITMVENCPPYQVYRCQKEDGKTFFINTLGCKPVYK